MKLLNQMVPAIRIKQMIDDRLEAVTQQYHYAVAEDRKVKAETLAETKWQLAELKMQFVELLSDLAGDELNKQPGGEV